MSKLEVKLMTEELLDKAETKGLLLRAPIDYKTLRANILNNGISICILEDSEVIGCAGVALLWQGVGEVWSVFSPGLMGRPLVLVRMMRQLLKKLKNSGNFHRVQMTVIESQCGLKRWAETLGFTFEGRMVKYGPDKKTHLRYALIF